MEKFYVSYSYVYYDRDTCAYKRKEVQEFIESSTGRAAIRLVYARCRSVKGFLGFKTKVVYTAKEAARLGIIYPA